MTHLLIEAIVVAIADPRLGDAMTRPRTSELEVRASLFSTEVALVRSIAAIVLRIALPDVGNASAVLASKLRSRASHISALKLVRMVATIVFLIAAEVQGNAAA